MNKNSIKTSVNTTDSWVTMLTWVNNYKHLIQHFRLSVAMAINHNEEFVQLRYATQQTFIKKNSVKIHVPAVRLSLFSL